MNINHKITMLNKHDMNTIKTKNKEIAIIVSEGQIRLEFEGNVTVLGNRNNVFEAFGESIYLPTETVIKIEAITEKVTLSILSMKSENPVLQTPLLKKESNFSIDKRGDEEYYREVSTLFDGKNGEKMIIGETLNKTGLWSGFPPHKHDQDLLDYETKNSEIYYVKTFPKDSFAVFLNYKKEINSEDITIVKNDETIMVEEGYHSIAALPKNKLYYLWALTNSNNGFLSSVDSKFLDWRLYD